MRWLSIIFAASKLEKLNYEQTLQFLYDQLPMFSRVGVIPHKLDLSKTLALANAFGNPHHHLSCIHVAGTNGKGSVSHMLAAIYQTAGYQTGLYTSPHYRDVRERIKLNGALVPKDFVVEFVDHYRNLNLDIRPSFFELAVVMSLEYFRREKVDIAIIETGLGGRLDSTNIITPLLSIITNISFDHQAQLGTTLDAIAGEKAGIIKKGVPVVIGEYHSETAPVFIKKASELESKISFANQNFDITPIDHQDGISTVYKILQPEDFSFQTLTTDLMGSYQKWNIQTVLQSIAVMQPHLPVSFEDLKQALQDVKNISKLIGRWDIKRLNPLVIMDSAHNEAGIRFAIDQLQKIPAKKLRIVFGVVKDKDPKEVLQILPKKAWYYFAKADIPRGLPAEELQLKALAHQLQGKVYLSVKAAYEAALEEAQPEDVIFVGGSIFVVAEII
jgi:dihydrofolate synthase/folylpolyglutamate synthase